MTLAVDTSIREKMSVSLLQDGRLVDKIEAQSDTWHSQGLLPAIIELLRGTSASPHDLTAITIHPGPGSFTGLRVGAAVGQALSFALNIPVNGKRSKETPVEVAY